MRNLRYFRLLAIVFAILLASVPSFAVEPDDIAVGLKTLPLLSNKMTGSVVVAIVVDAANAASKRESDIIKAAVEADPTQPGNITLSVRLVATSELTKLAGAQIAFLTTGTCTDEVSAASSANNLLSMSTDLACVRGNKCILGLVSRPNVEIYYSRTAAVAAHIVFTQTFSMLAKKV